MRRAERMPKQFPGLLAGLLFCAGCFTPVGEPDPWHRHRDGGVEGDGGLVGDGGSVVPVQPVIPGPACPAVNCGSFGAAGSVEAVVGVLSVLPWRLVALPTSICLPASDDLPVSSTVSLQASDVTPPPVCGMDGICAGVVFRISPEAVGVTCLDQFCTALLLNSSRFRLRKTYFDQYPNSPRFAPIIEVLPPCGVPCHADQRSCDANHTCWADDLEYCRFCLDAPQARCACADHREGADCQVYLTNDLTCAGKCAAATCVINPGQPHCPVQ